MRGDLLEGGEIINRSLETIWIRLAYRNSRKMAGRQLKFRNHGRLNTHDVRIY